MSASESMRFWLQTFTDFEHILLDDCSTDNSPNILLEYRNHPAVSHILPEHPQQRKPLHAMGKKESGSHADAMSGLPKATT